MVCLTTTLSCLHWLRTTTLINLRCSEPQRSLYRWPDKSRSVTRCLRHGTGLLHSPHCTTLCIQDLDGLRLDPKLMLHVCMVDGEVWTRSCLTGPHIVVALAISPTPQVPIMCMFRKLVRRDVPLTWPAGHVAWDVLARAVLYCSWAVTAQMCPPAPLTNG